MSYCPHCDKNTELVEKKKLSKQMAKGVVKSVEFGVNTAMKVHDQSVYETEKDQLLGGKYAAAHNRAIRNAESDSATQIMSHLNNKTLDATMGSDTYFACAECNGEIVHPQCHSRPEYLGASYDASSSMSQRFLGIFLLFGSYSLMAKFHLFSSKPTMFFISLGVAVAGYIGFNYVPLKPRGVVNLLSENIKTLVGITFLSTIILLIGGIFIEKNISAGTARDVAISIYMLAIMGGAGFSLFHFNKKKWGEIKETWKLLDEVESYTEEPISEDIDKAA